MNYLWIICFIVFVCSIFYLKAMYNVGAQKAFQKCLSIVVPVLLSGTATRIGHLILPNFLLISYYIAGIGTLIFYIVLRPILQKDKSDRYRRITKNSRILAMFIGLVIIWLVVSVFTFFFNLLAPNMFPQKVLDIILLPIYIFWFFPIK